MWCGRGRGSVCCCLKLPQFNALNQCTQADSARATKTTQSPFVPNTQHKKLSSENNNNKQTSNSNKLWPLKKHKQKIYSAADKFVAQSETPKWKWSNQQTIFTTLKPEKTKKLIKKQKAFWKQLKYYKWNAAAHCTCCIYVSVRYIYISVSIYLLILYLLACPKVLLTDWFRKW